MSFSETSGSDFDYLGDAFSLAEDKENKKRLQDFHSYGDGKEESRLEANFFRPLDGQPEAKRTELEGSETGRTLFQGSLEFPSDSNTSSSSSDCSDLEQSPFESTKSRNHKNQTQNAQFGNEVSNQQNLHFQEGQNVFADFWGVGFRSAQIVKANTDGSFDILYTHGAKEVKVGRKRIKPQSLSVALDSGEGNKVKTKQSLFSPGFVRTPGARCVAVSSKQKESKEGFHVSPTAVLDTMLQTYSEVAEIIQQNEQLEAKVKKLTNQLSKEAQCSEELEVKVTQMARQLEEQDALMEVLQKERNSRNQHVESLEKKNVEAESANQMLGARNESLEKQIKEMETENQIMNACNESLKKEHEDIQAENQLLAAYNESLQQKEQERHEKSFLQNDILGTLNELFENQERIQCIADESAYENIEKKLDTAVLSIRKAKETHIRKSAAKYSGAWNSECVICWDGPKEVLVHPCKHFCICLSCSKDIEKCPLCQQTVDSVDRIYAS